MSSGDQSFSVILLVVSILGLLLGVMVFAGYKGEQQQNAEAAHCEARGGDYIRQSSRFQSLCISKGVIISLD